MIGAEAHHPVVAAGQQFLPTVGPPTDPNTRFEEAAIKPLDGWNGQLLMQMTPGRFESYVSVSVVLRQALQKPDYQIVGAPGWVDSERYSITAKVPEGVPLTAMAAMLTNLLKDRFQLATHLETRDRPIFDLVVARPDGKLGPNLKPTPSSVPIWRNPWLACRLMEPALPLSPMTASIWRQGPASQRLISIASKARPMPWPASPSRT